MSSLLYSASDIAMIICIHDLGTKSQIDLLHQIWTYDRMYLEPEIRSNMKKFFTDVEHQCHYYYDKVVMDAEFPVIQRDAETTGITINEADYVSEYENIDLFFKNMRYRILYLDKNNFVKMKIRTMMTAYGYKRRSTQLIDYLKMCMCFYHIVSYSRGGVLCDIGEASLDTMITFRVL